MNARKIKRAKARQSNLYKVMPMLSGSVDPNVGNLLPDQVFVVDAKLEDCIVVSVPTSMSKNSADELADALKAELDQKVIIVTHNIHFCCVERVSDKKEINQVTQRLESGIDAQQQVNHFGLGSGIRQDRLCDPDMD